MNQAKKKSLLSERERMFWAFDGFAVCGPFSFPMDFVELNKTLKREFGVYMYAKPYTITEFVKIRTDVFSGDLSALEEFLINWKS